MKAACSFCPTEIAELISGLAWSVILTIREWEQVIKRKRKMLTNAIRWFSFWNGSKENMLLDDCAKPLVRKQLITQQYTLSFKSNIDSLVSFCFFFYFPQKQTKVLMNLTITITKFWKNQSNFTVKWRRITKASPHLQERTQKCWVNRLGLKAWKITRHMQCRGRRKTLANLWGNVHTACSCCKYSGHPIVIIRGSRKHRCNPMLTLLSPGQTKTRPDIKGKRHRDFGVISKTENVFL